MTKWLVFVDTEYYPYMAEPVEADTADEALRAALAKERLGIGDDIYVAPLDAVAAGTMQGPKRKPEGLLALMQEHNRLSQLRRDFAGGFSVIVEPGSVEP